MAEQLTMQNPVTQFEAKPPFKKQTQPVEVAPAYVFLAGQEASFITAEVIGVTGGNHLP